jgi:hypothetical protein
MDMSYFREILIQVEHNRMEDKIEKKKRKNHKEKSWKLLKG